MIPRTSMGIAMVMLANALALVEMPRDWASVVVNSILVQLAESAGWAGNHGIDLCVAARAATAKTNMAAASTPTALGRSSTARVQRMVRPPAPLTAILMGVATVAKVALAVA